MYAKHYLMPLFMILFGCTVLSAQIVPVRLNIQNNSDQTVVVPSVETLDDILIKGGTIAPRSSLASPLHYDMSIAWADLRNTNSVKSIPLLSDGKTIASIRIKSCITVCLRITNDDVVEILLTDVPTPEEETFEGKILVISIEVGPSHSDKEGWSIHATWGVEPEPVR